LSNRSWEQIVSLFVRGPSVGAKVVTDDGYLSQKLGLSSLNGTA
jgi:hypothetical protein